MSNTHPSPGGRPLEQLKVAELRDELRKRGMSLKGAKKDLIERLDEVVRKEQADTLANASEVGGHDTGVHGVHQLKGEHGDPRSDNTSETAHDGDSLLHLNDGENKLQASLLIVDNASPYVGPSDATPVLMEPHKDMEQPNIGFDGSEDDASLTHSVNAPSMGALPESFNEATENAPIPDSSELENTTVVSGANQGEGVDDIIQEPGKRASESETILSTREATNVDLSGDKHPASGNDVMPEVYCQAGEKGSENEGLPVAPAGSDMGTTVLVGPTDTTELVNEPIMGDATNVKIVPSVPASLGVEDTTQGEAVIPFEAVKDVAITSLPDDPLSVVNACLSRPSFVVNEPIMGDATNGETVPSVPASLGVEDTTQGEAVIPFEAVKDVAITSLSDDPLSVANAFLSHSNFVVNEPIMGDATNGETVPSVPALLGVEDTTQGEAVIPFEAVKDVAITSLSDDPLIVANACLSSPNFVVNGPIMGDATNGEIVPSVPVSLGVEDTTQGDAIIPFEAVKDVAVTSVSDDPLSVANVSLSHPSCVVNARSSSVQDGVVIEKDVLSSVNVVSCVQESVEDGSRGGLKIGTPEVLKDNFTVEEAKQLELLDGSEVSLPTQAVIEAMESAPSVTNLEAVQDPVLPEWRQVIAIAEPLQDALMHEEVQDLGVQRVQQDVEMSEATDSQSMKIEVSEMVLDTRMPSNAVDLHAEVKSEDMADVHPADLNQSNRASRDVHGEEGKPNVKLEPVEAESRVETRMAAVERVKVEQQDTKENIPKSGRLFDRSRPKDSEYERSRHEPARVAPYGNEMNKADGRSGRVFREERRKEPPKERDLKRDDEHFHDRPSQKRKDDGRNANPQESAKRVRRWNSGNELAAETSKSLTTSIAKEISSLEVKKEGLAVEPIKPTPKLAVPSRPMPGTPKANFEGNGDKKSVPPSTLSPTTSLKVERFVRPFTLKAVKELLAEFGQCVDFWMDQIKTHCYVRYSKVDEAVAARNGLYNKQWPASFGNLLVADFVDPSEVKMRSDGSFEKMNAPSLATAHRGNPNQPPAAQGAQLPGSFHGHSNSLASAAPLRERQLMAPMKESEPPVPTLDDLFRKTKTKPHIYYLPLTDEQVAEKLSAVKSKEQQQGRGEVLGRA